MKMKNPEQGLLTRWSIFIKERFPPIEHFLLIIFYFSANACVALSFFQLEYKQTPLKEILGFFVILFVLPFFASATYM